MSKLFRKNLQFFIKNGFNFIDENPRIIEKVYKTTLYNDEPKVYSYSCFFKDKYKTNSTNDSIASGVAFNKNRALLKLLGETIERYALTINNNKKFIFNSFNNLKRARKNLLNPVDILPFSKKQIEFHKIKELELQSIKIHWIPGKSLVDNKTILIPAQLVFVPYIYQNSEPLIMFPISTGTASGRSLEDAIYRGICEIVERDSFMICYLNKIPCPNLKISYNTNPTIQKILNSLKRYKIELCVIDITSDIKIPSIAAILIDHTQQGPAISCGLKAGFDIIDTIIGAIEEAVMLRTWIRDKYIYIEPLYKRGRIIRTVEDRAHFWFDIKSIKYLNFWLENSKTIKLKKTRSLSIKNKLLKISKLFKEKGIEVFYVDLTNKELSNYGFKIVKVIIPQLQPLYLDEYYKYFGKKRLFKAPVNMKVLLKQKEELELNKIPHPFL